MGVLKIIYVSDSKIIRYSSSFTDRPSLFKIINTDVTLIDKIKTANKTNDILEIRVEFHNYISKNNKGNNNNY